MTPFGAVTLRIFRLSHVFSSCLISRRWVPGFWLQTTLESPTIPEKLAGLLLGSHWLPGVLYWSGTSWRYIWSPQRVAVGSRLVYDMEHESVSNNLTINCAETVFSKVSLVRSYFPEKLFQFPDTFWISTAFYDACRALAGIGAGIMLPTAVALLAEAYPPGSNRNLAFGLFGEELWQNNWLLCWILWRCIGPVQRYWRSNIRNHACGAS